jgi:Ca2+-binding EF-hand superfamily protein
MKTLAKIALFTAAALALAPTAQASSYQARLTELRTKFKASDKNQDGKLTREEAKNGGMTRIASNFSRLDTDKDGYLTLAQLEAALAARYN